MTSADCQEIVKVCNENKVLLAVCHVWRYTPQAQKIKEIIDSGSIGDVINIQLLEPVANVVNRSVKIRFPVIIRQDFKIIMCM